MNFGDYSDDDSEYPFTIVDEKQPMVLVNIGGVPSVSMIVECSASCNVIDRQLWKSPNVFLQVTRNSCSPMAPRNH